jgi:hypothetical protein
LIVDPDSLSGAGEQTIDRRLRRRSAFHSRLVVYQVAIIDVAKIYAGTMVPNLNGATSANLDVVRFKLTTREAGVAADGNAVQVRAAIVTTPYWSPDERQAALGVMNALGSLRGTTTPLV